MQDGSPQPTVLFNAAPAIAACKQQSKWESKCLGYFLVLSTNILESFDKVEVALDVYFSNVQQ